MPIFVRRQPSKRADIPDTKFNLGYVLQTSKHGENGEQVKEEIGGREYEMGENRFFWRDKSNEMKAQRTLYERTDGKKIMSLVQVWGWYDPRVQKNVSVVIKYVPLRDREINFVNYFQDKNIRNIPRCKLMRVVKLNGSYHVPILMHSYNGDLLHFSYSSLSFYAMLDVPNILKLGEIVGRTYLNLHNLGYYYTDSKPANIFYHFIRPNKRGRNDYLPFNILLGDLGSMVNIQDITTTRFAAQTYPYPKIPFAYNCKNFEGSHENRKEMLERVVIWGLGILLLRMSLRKGSHQILFENTFVHNKFNRHGYEKFIAFLTMTTHTGDREYLIHIPRIIKDIICLNDHTTTLSGRTYNILTLRGVVDALADENTLKKGGSSQVGTSSTFRPKINKKHRPPVDPKKDVRKLPALQKRRRWSSSPQQQQGGSQWSSKKRRWVEDRKLRGGGPPSTKEMILQYEKDKTKSLPLRRKYNKLTTKNMLH